MSARAVAVESWSEIRLRFERTHDLSMIRSIITNRSIYKHLGDDTMPTADRFTPAEDPSIWYVLVFDGEERIGMFALFPESSACWNLHTCLLPQATWVRGRSLAAIRGVFEWVFTNTECRRIITRVPDFNRLALRFGKKSGMLVWGVNPMSFLKYGKLHDQTYFGISKPVEV